MSTAPERSGRVAGKTALVTGAARGQGRAHVLALAREGADIIAVDVPGEVHGLAYDMGTAEELEATAAEARNLGARVAVIQCDVRNGERLVRAVEDGVRDLGALDVVVANAGIAGVPYATHEIPQPVWEQMLDVNLTGVWNTVRAGVPHLIRSGGGSVILTSSAAGLTRGYANIAHYAAAKHGTVGLMRTLATELGAHGIRANTIHPTQVNTPMINNPATYQLFCPGIEGPTVEDFLPVSTSMHVLPTPWVEPEDVSNVVLFLASDEARFVTGATIPVDAGCLVK